MDRRSPGLGRPAAVVVRAERAASGQTDRSCSSVTWNVSGPSVTRAAVAACASVTGPATLRFSRSAASGGTPSRARGGAASPAARRRAVLLPKRDDLIRRADEAVEVLGRVDAVVVGVQLDLEAPLDAGGDEGANRQLAGPLRVSGVELAHEHEHELVLLVVAGGRDQVRMQAAQAARLEVVREAGSGVRLRRRVGHGVHGRVVHDQVQQAGRPSLRVHGKSFPS